VYNDEDCQLNDIFNAA